MSAWFRIFVLSAFGLLGACSTQEEARQQHGIPHDETSDIPESTPGPGIEKIKTRPDATPTPKPTSSMDKPLDPTGLPQG